MKALLEGARRAEESGEKGIGLMVCPSCYTSFSWLIVLSLSRSQLLLLMKVTNGAHMPCSSVGSQLATQSTLFSQMTWQQLYDSRIGLHANESQKLFFPSHERNTPKALLIQTSNLDLAFCSTLVATSRGLKTALALRFPPSRKISCFGTDSVLLSVMATSQKRHWARTGKLCNFGQRIPGQSIMSVSLVSDATPA